MLIELKVRMKQKTTKASHTRMTIGCIGAGDIVRAAHLPVLKAMHDVEVTWVIDPNEARAKQLAKVYDVPYLPLPQKLEELPIADAYLMACPFGARDPYYSLLRSRCAHIYVEKPFARSSKRHAELCSWFPDFSLASGLMMRSWGPNMLARQIVHEQVFGPVRAVRFGFGKPGLVTHGNYYFESKKGGAGLTSEVGIHGIDATLFVSRAVEAEVESANTVLEGDLDLHTEARLRSSDAEGHEFSIHFTISSLQPTIEGMEIDCEYATLSYPLPGQGYAVIAESPRMDVSVRPRNGRATYTIRPSYIDLYPNTKFQMFHENWRLFIEGITSRIANQTSAAHSYLTTKVIEQCLSAGKGSQEL